MHPCRKGADQARLVVGGGVVLSSRKESRGGRAFAAPLFGIILLLACYLLLAQWDDLPTLLNAALAAVHWPV